MTTIPVFQYTTFRPNQNRPQPELDSPTLEVGPVREACGKRYVKLRVKHADLHSVDVIEVDLDLLDRALHGEPKS